MSPRPTKSPLLRTFPPFPPTPGRRGAFASTWWGEAWVTALEECSLDSGRLSRGRTYARRGAVGEVTVAPGRVSAQSTGRPPAELAQAVRAWRHGGATALAVLEDSWSPDPGVLARARASLTEDWSGPAPKLRAWRNRWTVVGRDVQLR